MGLGSIGQRHLRNLKALLGEGVSCSACRERRLQLLLGDEPVPAGGGLEERYRLRVFTSLQEALEEKPEVVFVTNPSSRHLETALAAARAGCHLFIEKPLSHSWQGVEELIALVEERRLVARVGFQYRYHPCLKSLKRILDEGGLGGIMAVSVQVGEYLPDWHPYEDYRESYAARADLGGGVVLTQMSHELDYLGWLFGRPRRVYALGGSRSCLGLEVEDTVLALMEYDGGGADVPVQIQADYLQRPPVRRLQVTGDQGKVLVDLLRPALVWYGRQGRRVLEESYYGYQRNRLFLEELRSFLDCLKGGAPPLSGLRQGAESLRAALAVKESLTSGRVVELI